MCGIDVDAAAGLVDALTRRLHTVLTCRRRRALARARLVGRARAVAQGARSSPTSTARGARAAAAQVALQPSNQAPIADEVLAPVAECWMAKLVGTPFGKRQLLGFGLAGLDAAFVRTLRARRATKGGARRAGGRGGAPVHRDHPRALAPLAAHGHLLEARLIDVWYAKDLSSTAATLAAVALRFRKVLVAAEAEYGRRAAAGQLGGGSARARDLRSARSCASS